MNFNERESQNLNNLFKLRNNPPINNSVDQFNSLYNKCINKDDRSKKLNLTKFVDELPIPPVLSPRWK
ncbi:hypothetical protein, partial [Gottfriedia acidiceleris]|uniref:hypothetical protein n=1 Tax=Gottfriedia acidiceleris TaxID=371036 RepID=UPI003000CF72